MRTAAFLTALALSAATPALCAQDESPQRDPRERYVELEDEAYGYPHDPEAWAELLAVAAEIEDRESAMWHRFYDEFGFHFIPSNGSDNYPAYRAVKIPGEDASPEIDERVARFLRAEMDDVLGSDLPERLFALADSPGLRPRPFENIITLNHSIASEGDLGTPRALTLTGVALAGHALSEGDEERFERALTTNFALSRMMAKRPLTLSMLIGNSMETRTLETIREAITLDDATPEMREIALGALATHVALRPRGHAYLDGEHLAALDMMRALYNGEQLDEHTRADPWKVWANYPSEETSRRHWALWIESMRTFAATPPHARDDLEQTPGGVLDSFDRGSRLVDSLAPVIERSMRVVDRTESGLHGELVRLAIVVHRDRTGALPETLEDLVRAGVLSELPRDPYATDGRFRYVRDVTAPRGFVLYSVGGDCEDNGGLPHPDEGHVRHVTTHEGRDHLFEPVPEAPKTEP